MTISAYLPTHEEEGTIAANLKSQVSEKEKERRRETIMNEQAAISAAINKTTDRLNTGSAY
ncbi:MAG: hypothetical protein MZV70_48000 [Desulfobacterales bacterium]|nr:hypothetical protein [Desulfobacterales bacterium]